MTILKPDHRRIDAGRLIMVPAATMMLVVDAIVLAHADGTGITGTLRWIGTALVAAFYAVIIWAYLRRGPAKATSKSITAHVAAITATLLPFVFPLLNSATVTTRRVLVADVLLVAGTAWAVWSLVTLGRNLSVIAQAREVVEHGPYRWIRHPLYTGEIVSSLGLAITAGTTAAAGAWLLLVALQVYRARSEEQVLIGALPTYASYRTRTAALLPGVF
ncbi:MULTISPECIES: methyltransferase family protein [unclassified Kribbella]|uniref:methyltransferase family protein n=1 Tax=unclassified Kribbella TaxID=2644121 RepID=UPI003018539B